MDITYAYTRSAVAKQKFSELYEFIYEAVKKRLPMHQQLKVQR